MSAPPPYSPYDSSKQNMGAPYPATGYPVNSGYPAQPGYPPAHAYPTSQAYPPNQTYPQALPAGFQPAPGFAAYPMPQGVAPTMMPAVGLRPNMVSGGGNAYQPGGESSAPQEPKDEVPRNAEQFGASFDDKIIRHAFIRKVYLILLVQLLVTLGFIALFTFHDGLKYYVQRNMWVYILSYVVFIVTVFTLACCPSLRRKYPTNIILLGIFTLAMSYMTGAISSFYDTEIVFFAVGITALICFLLSLFAFQTKYDFTGWGTYLYVAVWILFFFGIVAIFVRIPIMQTIYSACIALIFSMYLVYDTQMLVGGKKYELSTEEHIFGALSLYLDVVQIFLAVLSLSRN